MNLHPAFARFHAAALAALLLSVTALPSHAFEIRWGSGHAVTGSGKTASESRPLTGFQAIALRGPVDLVLRQGSHEAVEVRADDNLIPLVETRVEERGSGRTLVVGLRKGESVHTRNRLVVTVDAVQITALASTGSGDIKVESLKTPSLQLAIDGSADARFASLQTGELNIAINGSGDVDASGSATRLKITIAGSGDARLARLQSDEVAVSIAGSGDADVVANKTLSVSIAGSGDVVYRGTGTLVSSSVVGSGGVKHR
jgi:hypothetical protein